MASNIVATGQISIIDHNDALSLTAYVTSNKTKTQMYNPDNDSYTPDWTQEKVTLTPSLFILGTASDVISSPSVKSIKWYDITDGAKKEIVSGGAYRLLSGGKLQIVDNVMAGLSGKDYMVHIVYHDDSTRLDLPIETDISFSRVVNGSGIADAIAWLPDGNVFKNGEVDKLTIQCDFWRGSVIDSDDVSYQWYQHDPKQSTDVGAGTGWAKLSNTSTISGVTTNTLTVYPDAVVGYEVFKCIIKDTDTDSNSYGREFVDTATLIDQSDPIQCTVVSSGGTVFKNGDGQTTITAKLYRAGGEIDADGKKYTYKWYKYDNDGELVTDWGGSGIDYKTGKTITAGSNDVDTKATFSVEVEG